MKSKEMVISPDVARELLKDNHCNRPLRQRHVDFLASQMASGRWRLSHQGICQADSGRLLDGQHRLLAVIQSGVTVTMMYTNGCEEELMDVIDVGMRPRSVSDILHLQDGLEYSAMHMAALRHIVFIFCGYQKAQLSVEYSRELLKKFQDPIQRVHDAIKEGAFKPAKDGWVIGTLAMCLRADPAVEAFLTKFASGVDLTAKDPAKALRDWFIKGNSKNLAYSTKRSGTECICNAIYNSIQGNNLTQIRVGETGVAYFTGKLKDIGAKIRAELKQQL